MKHDYGFIYNTKDLFFEPAFIAWRFKLCWSRLPFPLPVFELSLYRWLSQVSSFRTLAPFSHHDHDWYLCCEQGRLDFCFSSQIISSVFFFFFFFFSSVLLPGLFSSRWFIIYPFSWQKFLRKATQLTLWWSEKHVRVSLVGQRASSVVSPAVSVASIRFS